jgi:hypothetical protein
MNDAATELNATCAQTGSWSDEPMTQPDETQVASPDAGDASTRSTELRAEADEA